PPPTRTIFPYTTLFRSSVKKADDVPYNHYRDCYCQLLQRVQPDTTEEAWVLLPGVEEEARAYFAAAAKDGLSKAAVEQDCRRLQDRKSTRLNSSHLVIS